MTKTLSTQEFEIMDRKLSDIDMRNAEASFTQEEQSKIFPYPPVLTDQDYFPTNKLREGDFYWIPPVRHPHCFWYPERKNFVVDEAIEEPKTSKVWPDILISIAGGCLIAGIGIGLLSGVLSVTDSQPACTIAAGEVVCEQGEEND